MLSGREHFEPVKGHPSYCYVAFSVEINGALIHLQITSTQLICGRVHFVATRVAFYTSRFTNECGFLSLSPSLYHPRA